MMVMEVIVDRRIRANNQSEPGIKKLLRGSSNNPVWREVVRGNGDAC